MLARLVEKLEVQHASPERSFWAPRTSRNRFAAQRSRSRHGSSPTARAFAGGFRRGSASSPRRENVVTEGRDQGTLVFPDAFRKYYLTASDEERARRRLADYAAAAGADEFRGRAGRDSCARRPRRGPRDRPDETGRRCDCRRLDRFDR